MKFPFLFLALFLAIFHHVSTFTVHQHGPMGMSSPAKRQSSKQSMTTEAKERSWSGAFLSVFSKFRRGAPTTSTTQPRHTNTTGDADTVSVAVQDDAAGAPSPTGDATSTTLSGNTTTEADSCASTDAAVVVHSETQNNRGTGSGEDRLHFKMQVAKTLLNMYEPLQGCGQATSLPILAHDTASAAPITIASAADALNTPIIPLEQASLRLANQFKSSPPPATRAVADFLGVVSELYGALINEAVGVFTARFASSPAGVDGRKLQLEQEGETSILRAVKDVLNFDRAVRAVLLSVLIAFKEEGAHADTTAAAAAANDVSTMFNSLLNSREPFSPIAVPVGVSRSRQELESLFSYYHSRCQLRMWKQNQHASNQDLERVADIAAGIIQPTADDSGLYEQNNDLRLFQALCGVDSSTLSKIEKQSLYDSMFYMMQSPPSDETGGAAVRNVNSFDPVAVLKRMNYDDSLTEEEQQGKTASSSSSATGADASNGVGGGIGGLDIDSIIGDLMRIEGLSGTVTAPATTSPSPTTTTTTSTTSAPIPKGMFGRMKSYVGDKIKDKAMSTIQNQLMKSLNNAATASAGAGKAGALPDLSSIMASLGANGGPSNFNGMSGMTGLGDALNGLDPMKLLESMPKTAEDRDAFEKSIAEMMRESTKQVKYHCLLSK